MSFAKFYLVSLLIGIVTGIGGYPIWDAAKNCVNGTNLSVVLLLITIGGILCIPDKKN